MKEQDSPIGIEGIQKVLPHRYPFLLVDRVLERKIVDSDKGKQGSIVKVLKNVTFNEFFFPGHFPKKPIMPGVLLIEAMAQAGALARFREGEPQMDVAIVNVKDAKFRRPVVPGDSLIITCEIEKDRGQMILISSQTHVDGRLVCEAKILASITEAQ